MIAVAGEVECVFQAPSELSQWLESSFSEIEQRQSETNKLKISIVA